MKAQDPNGASRATQPLAALREILVSGRTAKPAELNAVLIDVVDGLITHAEKQARLIEDLRSDISHKQGIVSNIGGGDYGTSSTPANDERNT